MERDQIHKLRVFLIIPNIDDKAIIAGTQNVAVQGDAQAGTAPRS